MFTSKTPLKPTPSRNTLEGRKKPQNSGRLKSARHIRERKIKRSKVSESLLAIIVGTNTYLLSQKILSTDGARCWGDSSVQDTQKSCPHDILAINV